MKILYCIIISCLITINLISCRKESRFQCETWEYYDECTPKNAAVTGCTKGINTNGNFCDVDLNGIAVGATRKIYEDADRIVTRHFVAKKS